MGKYFPNISLISYNVFTSENGQLSLEYGSLKRHNTIKHDSVSFTNFAERGYPE